MKLQAAAESRKECRFPHASYALLFVASSSTTHAQLVSGRPVKYMRFAMCPDSVRLLDRSSRWHQWGSWKTIMQILMLWKVRSQFVLIVREKWTSPATTRIGVW